jgi:hypothetical protein
MDWWPVAERLASIVGQPLLAEGVARPRTARRRSARRALAPAADGAQLGFGLERPREATAGDEAR